MKPTNFMLLAMLGLSFTAYSQKKTGTDISGYVTNPANGEHLPFINIALRGTTIGTTTNASGHYILKNLPSGRFVITASGIGYKMDTREVLLRENSPFELNFTIEEDQILLDGIVVTANRNETNRQKATTIVNVISPRIFENTSSVCLAQGLNFQPGLRIETNCQNCGFQQVRINGLDGPYSQILIDSHPVFSALAGVYGIEQIPANMIERVEVVRGGGSALFGSNAIAGTINIITREPLANSVTLSNTSTLIYGRKADINTTLNASVVSDDYKAGIMIYGSTRQRSPFEYDGDGFTEIGKINVKNIGFNGYFKPGNHSKISLEYHNLGEFRRGGNKLDLPPHESDICEQIEHNINAGSLRYEVFGKNGRSHLNFYTSVQEIKRESYYGAQKDPNAYGSTSDNTYAAGVQYSTPIDSLLLFPSRLTLGTEYNSNSITDKMLGYDRVIDQKVSTASVYLQNEWTAGKLSLLIGGRLDKNNLISDPVFSPRANIRYSPVKPINLRMSFSSGFRAPQAFDEDLHVTAVGGNVAIICLDPDLKTEKSRSYSGSVDFYPDFDKMQTNILIEGFYTSLENVFVLEETGTDESGNILLERRNGSGAVVKGVNIEFRLVPGEHLQLQSGITFQKSEYNEDQLWSDNESLSPQHRMFRSPDRYGYITLTYEAMKQMNISLSGTYTGTMLVQHFAGYIPEDSEYNTPGFYDLSLRLSYDFRLNTNSKLQLNGGVLNIFNSYQNDFDRGEFRDAGYIYGPALPLSVFAGVKIMI